MGGKRGAEREGKWLKRGGPCAGDLNLKFCGL